MTEPILPPVSRLARSDDVDLAYHWHKGKPPILVFLHGWLSDMTGTKSMAVLEDARKNGQACLLFDFSGHGRSQGELDKRTMSQWQSDVLAMLDWVATQTSDPVLLIGSSFGGNHALLAALARPKQIGGLLLIAPAVDMTERLLRPSLTSKMQEELAQTGATTLVSPDGAYRYPISQALLDDGVGLCLLDKPQIDITCPVRVLHGQRDDSVGWKLTLKLAEKLASDDVRLLYFKRGAHSLSEPDELQALLASCAELSAVIGAQN